MIIRYRHEFLTNPLRDLHRDFRTGIRNKLFIHIRLLEIINPHGQFLSSFLPARLPTRVHGHPPRHIPWQKEPHRKS